MLFVFGLSLLPALSLCISTKQESSLKIEPKDGLDSYINVNGGWQLFQYNQSSPTSLYTRLFCSGSLKLTGLLCSGAQFTVYDNGKQLGNTSVPVFNTCESHTLDPEYAYNNSNWTHAEWTLGPGYHNITVEVLKFNFGTNTAAIRIDATPDHQDRHHRRRHRHHDHRGCDHGEHHSNCSAKTCSKKSKNFVYMQTAVPRCQADDLCRTLGLSLAQVDSTTFLEATGLVYKCGGANSRVWVDDWNGDAYMGSCLMMTVGSRVPGGSINAPKCCSEAVPVLCQMKDYNHPLVKYNCDDR